MQKPKLSLIVAMARNRVIGNNNDLPWHIPEDLKRFKELTINKPVIMGRKTFDSIINRIGKPLPHRPHFVVSQGGFDNKWDNVTICNDLNAAITVARNAYPYDDIAIIGGASIYKQAINVVDVMYLTMIDVDIDGDSYFPEFNKNEWTEKSKESITNAALPFTNIILIRK